MRHNPAGGGGGSVPRKRVSGLALPVGGPDPAADPPGSDRARQDRAAFHFSRIDEQGYRGAPEYLGKRREILVAPALRKAGRADPRATCESRPRAVPRSALSPRRSWKQQDCCILGSAREAAHEEIPKFLLARRDAA